MSGFQPQRLLITGGAGFIGINAVRHFVECFPRCRIVVLDALTYAADRDALGDLESAGAIRFVHGDIRDRQRLEALFADEAFDAVVHLAAESHVDRSIVGPDAFVATNVNGTCNLLEAARRAWSELRAEHCRFHHISTDEVYGSLGEGGCFTEASPYRPNSPYAASKAASDHLVRAWHHTYGLPVVVTNCSNNYGPHQHAEKLIPTIINSALAEQPIPVYGDGRHIRDWLYVGDHCRALEAVLTRGTPGETYLIGGETERTNLELVEGICDLLERRRSRHNGASYRDQIRFVADRPGHDLRYAVDCSRIKTELGWSQRVSLDEGLAETVDWYLRRHSATAGDAV